MDRERYEWCPKAEEGIIRSMLTKDSHPRAYIFPLCNEKFRAFVVLGTTRTKEKIESDEKYNLHQHNGTLGTHKGKVNLEPKIKLTSWPKRMN